MKMIFLLAAPSSAWQRSAALFTWTHLKLTNIQNILKSPNVNRHGVVFEDNVEDERTEFDLCIKVSTQNSTQFYSNPGKIEPFEEILEVFEFDQISLSR